MIGREVFNPEALIRFADGDEDLARQACHLFIEGKPGMVANIQVAIESGNHDLLYRSAHALKGAASAVCAETVAHLAGDLELMGRTNNFSGAHERFGHLEHALLLLDVALGVFAEK